MSFSNQNTSNVLLWNKVGTTHWAIGASGSQTFPRAGGWQNPSLQCYCAGLTHQLLKPVLSHPRAPPGREPTWQSRETLTVLAACAHVESLEAVNHINPLERSCWMLRAGVSSTFGLAPRRIFLKAAFFTTLCYGWMRPRWTAHLGFLQ